MHKLENHKDADENRRESEQLSANIHGADDHALHEVRERQQQREIEYDTLHRIDGRSLYVGIRTRFETPCVTRFTYPRAVVTRFERRIGIDECLACLCVEIEHALVHHAVPLERLHPHVVDDPHVLRDTLWRLRDDTLIDEVADTFSDLLCLGIGLTWRDRIREEILRGVDE